MFADGHLIPPPISFSILRLSFVIAGIARQEAMTNDKRNMENEICRKTSVSPLLADYLPLDQRLRRHQVIAEVREVLECPDHFLVAGDFDELRVFRARMRVADDQVAVG